VGRRGGRGVVIVTRSIILSVTLRYVCEFDAPAALPPQQNPLVPQGLSGKFGEEKEFLLLQGIKPRLLRF
jgi:hypothetical protein